MSERKYYCFCGSNCKYETMTKEQILAAITQAVESGVISDVDTGFVTKIKEQNAGGYVSFWVGTTAQYNALAGKDPNCMYILNDDTSGDDLKNWIVDTFATNERVGNVVADFNSVTNDLSNGVETATEMAKSAKFRREFNIKSDTGKDVMKHTANEAYFYIIEIADPDDYDEGEYFSSAYSMALDYFSLISGRIYGFPNGVTISGICWEDTKEVQVQIRDRNDTNYKLVRFTGYY